jgi:hypothetical protein
MKEHKDAPQAPHSSGTKPPKQRPDAAAEVGGRKGPEPTRYGDWEVSGRCVDF